MMTKSFMYYPGSSCVELVFADKAVKNGLEKIKKRTAAW